MSVRKSCYTCKHYKHGLCSNGSIVICGDDMSGWELSDDAKANLLHDAEPEHDAVNSPAHYTSGGIECIDCIKAALGKNFIGFLIGNVIEYTYQYKDKNGAENLKNARRYLDLAIKELMGREENG